MKDRWLRRLVIPIVLFGGPPASPANSATGPGGPAPEVDVERTGPEPVVTGRRDIVVHGRARRCTKLRNDPLNSVNATPIDGHRQQSEIVSDGRGGYVLQQEQETITGADFWTRAGTAIDDYVFRAPTNGAPLCIGARRPGPEGYGQLRQIVDAAPYRGQRVRFTVWAATGEARLVRFWLAAGRGATVLTNGGNTNNQAWGGSHGWTPILLEIGPVAKSAEYISYGFLLHGAGDVWFYHPKLEIVTDDPAVRRHGDIAVIGSDKSDY